MQVRIKSDENEVIADCVMKAYPDLTKAQLTIVMNWLIDPQCKGKLYIDTAADAAALWPILEKYSLDKDRSSEMPPF